MVGSFMVGLVEGGVTCSTEKKSQWFIRGESSLFPDPPHFGYFAMICRNHMTASFAPGHQFDGLFVVSVCLLSVDSESPEFRCTAER